jgi:hypothetical protein
MEKIAHGIHENHPGPFPFERLQEPFGSDRVKDFELLLKPVITPRAANNAGWQTRQS